MVKELQPRCNQKDEHEMGCLQLERADRTAIIFAEIPKKLQCKKDTFDQDEKYHPFPTLKDQTKSNIAEVDCQEYKEAFQKHEKDWDQRKSTVKNLVPYK